MIEFVIKQKRQKNKELSKFSANINNENSHQIEINSNSTSVKKNFHQIHPDDNQKNFVKNITNPNKLTNVNIQQLQCDFSDKQSQQQVLSICSSNTENKQNKKPHEQYDKYRIPPDWEQAKIHAKSRETKPELENGEIQMVCQCCGYEINRKEINMKIDVISLGFLGSGYSLYFNFLKNSILMLISLLFIYGIPNLIINSQGNFCNSSLKEVYEQLKSIKLNQNSAQLIRCQENFAVKYSLANILDQKETNNMMIYFTIMCSVIQFYLVLNFRKEQKIIEAQVDEKFQTPSDFSIIVTNIPPELKNPEKIIKEMFTYQAVKGQKMNVCEVMLIYDISQNIELEKKAKELIKQKQKLMKKYNYNDIFVQNIDQQINQIQFQQKKLELENLQNYNKKQKFAGIAIISFETEEEKFYVLDSNTLPSYKKFYYDFLNKGKSPQYCDSLYIKDRHLYIEQAPEPNEILWQNLHVNFKQQITGRILGFIFQIIFMAISFSSILLISYFQSLTIEHAYENALQQQQIKYQDQLQYFSILTFTTSALIILFNKFFIPKVIKTIVGLEKQPNLTLYNISYGRKLSILLFANTALITFLVELVVFHNYYEIAGGFIQSEFLIFIFNAFVPPLIWFLDPWYYWKKWKREREIKKGQQSTLTQEEANLLMENPEYSIGKRYAENLKTIWLTFFYSAVIPMGIVWSIIGIFLYYQIDKYNIIYRRTVKESIGKNLTIEMIGLLEYSSIFYMFGNLFFVYQLKNEVNMYYLGTLIVLLITTLLPMQNISDWLFPIKSKNETVTYSNSKFFFDTNYDRENPAVRKHAIQNFYMSRQNSVMQSSVQREGNALSFQNK